MTNKKPNLAVIIACFFGCTLPLTANFTGHPGVADHDLAVVNVSVPDTGCLRAENIVAVVENVGTSAATGFMVTYRINQTIPITTSVGKTLAASDTMHVSFANQFDFTAPVTYLLEVWVTYTEDEVPANDTLTKNVVSLEKPTAAFDATLECVHKSSLFTDVSTHPEGITTRQWFVGSAANLVDSGAEAQIHFPQQTQNIGLIATAANGCTDTVLQQISAHPKPDAAFTAENGCPGEPIQFDNQSQITNDSIAQYEWSWGDGSISTEVAPQHVYESSGTYSAILLAISAHGCADTFEAQVEVYEKPTAAFTYDEPVCEGAAVEFTDQSAIASGSVTGLNWHFGDGSNATGSLVTHTFGEGTFEVSLVATSNLGCTDTATEEVTANAAPMASFSVDPSGCEMDTFSFVNESLISTGSIADYGWNFDDGGAATSENPDYVFQSAGTYHVTLVVSSQMGCEDDTVVQVTVFDKPPKPVIQQSGDTLFTTISGVYQWFLDGNLIAGATDSFHVATQQGAYTVQVGYIECSNMSDPFVVTGMGPADGWPVKVQVYPNPTTGTVKITLAASRYISASLELWSMEGRKIAVLRELKNVKDWRGEFSLEDQAAGTYFLLLKSASNGKTSVWAIQKTE
jgi:PKD repeat protein